MNFVSYNNIRLKCYINVSKCHSDVLYIAPHEVVGSPILARAIAKFKSVFNEIKKIECGLIFTYFRLQNLELSHLIVGLKIFSA